MTPRFVLSLVAVGVSMALAPASAQQLVISTAAAGNTYDLMTRQLSAACPAEGGRSIVGKPSTGSMESVDRLLANEVPAAIVQADVLRYRERKDDMHELKALFPLHPEELHVLALSETRSFGGVPGFGWLAAIPGLSGLAGAPFKSLADLRGRRVGAWGGSVVTAQVVRLEAEIGSQVVEFADEATAVKALTEKSVDALLSVGGSPQPWVQRLDRRFRLVPIADADVDKLKGVYRRARLSYGNLGQSGVQTVSTDAVMVVQDYRTTTMSSLLLWARDCFSRRLPELQETPGTQATWRKVDPTKPPAWPLYVGPAARPIERGGKAMRRSGAAPAQ